MSKFYVYGKLGCGYCDKLTSFMDTKGVKYEKFTVGVDLSVEQFLNKFGRGSTFPQVCHDTTNIGGMKDTVRYLIDHRLV